MKKDKLRKYKIIHLTEDKLIIKTIKLPFIWELLYSVFFLSIWYFLIIIPHNSPIRTFKITSIPHLLYLILVIAPLLYIPNLIKIIKSGLISDQMIFDRAAGYYFKDQVPVTRLSNIEFLQIRVFQGDNKLDNEYRVSLKNKSPGKILLFESNNKAEVHEICEGIADYLDVVIKKK